MSVILFIFQRDDFDLVEVEVTEDKTFRGKSLPRGWLHTPLTPGGVVFSPAGTVGIGIFDLRVLHVSFEPRVASHYDERTVLRDPYQNFAAVDSIPMDEDHLVCGVTDADKERIFG